MEGAHANTHKWIINGVHDAVETNLPNVEFQEVRREVPRRGLEDVLAPVCGHVF